jgi:hypothetical protein
MINTIIKQILIFTKLPANRQVIFLLLGMICLFAFVTYYSWTINQSNNLQIVKEKSIKLDTCESRNSLYLKEITYWKDSLYSEKVKNLNEQVKKMESLSNNVKVMEDHIIKTNNNIKNKQYKILKSLENEK